MKKLTFLVVFCVTAIGLSYAQENQEEKDVTVYTFFVNIVNEQLCVMGDTGRWKQAFPAYRLLIYHSK